MNTNPGNRTVNVKVRLTEDEHDYLLYRQKAIHAPTLSAYIRYAAINKKLVVLDHESLMKITSDISGIRNSLNQIAKRLNATNQFYAEDRITIESAIKDMDRIWSSVTDLWLKQP